MTAIFQKHSIQTMLKLGAFLFPLFFIYGPFNDDEYNGLSDKIWKFIVAGLFFDLFVLFSVLIITVS